MRRRKEDEQETALFYWLIILVCCFSIFLCSRPSKGSEIQPHERVLTLKFDYNFDLFPEVSKFIVYGNGEELCTVSSDECTNNTCNIQCVFMLNNTRLFVNAKAFSFLGLSTISPTVEAFIFWNDIEPPTNLRDIVVSFP